MRRESYFNDELLAETTGRCRFGASDIEARIAEFEVPQPKPWVYPSHPLDGIAAEFGMKGFEYRVLQDAALEEMRHNEVLRSLYRNFLATAKLICNDQLERARKHEQKLAEERVQRDNKYVHQMKEHEGKVRSLTESWNRVRGTIRTRWAKIIRSLAALLERDASLTSMADRDYAFVNILKDRGLLEIEGDRVTKVDWVKLEDTYIEDIYEILLELNNSPAGGFFKERIKP